MTKPKTGKGTSAEKVNKISAKKKEEKREEKSIEKSAELDDIISQIITKTGKQKDKELKEQKEQKEKKEQKKIPEHKRSEKKKIKEEKIESQLPAAKIKETKEAKETKEGRMPEAGSVPFEALGPEVAKEKIDVKQILRIASGIPGLDEMTDGGFEEKSILLVNGDPGSGKTIFGLQFLYAGAQRGEAGLYISFGEPREWLYPRMMSFGMNFQELEDKKLFFVIEYQPHEIAKLMQEEGGTIYDIVMAYNVQRIVVDPITPYLVQFENLYDARLALVRLMNVVRKWNATTLLLSEVSTKIEPHPTSALTEFLTDGVLNLIHRRTEEGIQLRGIEIWKLCGIAHMEVARPFAFTKRGITVYPTERLFAKSK